MRLSPRGVSVFCLLLACADPSPDDGVALEDASVDQGAGPDGGAPAGDGGRAAMRDGGSADPARADAGRDAPVDERDAGDSNGRDGGGRERDAAAPTQPDDASVAATTSLAQHCVDEINRYRATLALAPLARAADKEACVDAEAEADSKSGKAHGAFGMCKESAQNECPGWPSKDMKSSLDGCLKQMWAEGPGDFNAGHGHYINMSSTKYKSVACGVHDIGNGKFWAIQDFF